MVILFPLPATLRIPIAAQQRPKWTSGLAVPSPVLTLPWSIVQASPVTPRVVHALRPLPAVTFHITGVTKDETGAAAGGFTVYLFDLTSGVPVLVDTTVSDGSGNYTFAVGQSQRYWAVDYKAGSPDKTGATVNTLSGA